MIIFYIYGIICILSFYRELKDNYVPLEEMKNGIDNKERILVVDKLGEIFVHKRSVCRKLKSLLRSKPNVMF